MSVNAVPPLVTSIAGDFGFLMSTFGYLFSLQFLVFMIASFTGGVLLEKTGVKPGLLVAIGAGSLGVSLGPLLSSAVIRTGGFQSFFPVLSAGLVLRIVFMAFSKRTVENKGVSV